MVWETPEFRKKSSEITPNFVELFSFLQLKSILDGVTELFSSVLGDKNCTLRQMSLQAFSKFAEVKTTNLFPFLLKAYTILYVFNIS